MGAGQHAHECWQCWQTDGIINPVDTVLLCLSMTARNRMECTATRRPSDECPGCRWRDDGGRGSRVEGRDRGVEGVVAAGGGSLPARKRWGPEARVRHHLRYSTVDGMVQSRSRSFGGRKALNSTSVRVQIRNQHVDARSSTHRWWSIIDQDTFPNTIATVSWRP